MVAGPVLYNVRQIHETGLLHHRFDVRVAPVATVIRTARRHSHGSRLGSILVPFSEMDWQMANHAPSHCRNHASGIPKSDLEVKGVAILDFSPDFSSVCVLGVLGSLNSLGSGCREGNMAD